ncbi:MAG: aldo/keto reductase [Chloroflexi bacterium]|nr:aldo/keto reductase [Chloroflexota bacterium]MBV9543385.1 aldo/keto reductase [Chloroflexota bacterium]
MMEYRQLGRTGVQVSALCLGCMMFGRRTSPEDSYPIIDRALDAGLNFVDTANVYSRGASEEITGEALKRNGKRQRVVLATKVHGRMADDDPNAAGNSRRHIVAACEASLRRLQTDYIDLYQIHRPEAPTPIDETLRALDDLIRSGKVRYIGTSTFGAWQVVESLWASKELGLNRFVTEQPPYNILDRRIERELVPMAQTFGIGLVPWSPIAGGLLSGKYRRGQPLPADSRYATENNPNYKFRLVDGVYDVVDRLDAMAQSKDCTMVQLAVAWVLAQPAIASPIIGPRTMGQLEEYLGASSVKFEAADLEAIDGLVPHGGMVSPFYQADFGPHPNRVF